MGVYVVERKEARNQVLDYRRREAARCSSLVDSERVERQIIWTARDGGGGVELGAMWTVRDGVCALGTATGDPQKRTGEALGRGTPALEGTRDTVGAGVMAAECTVL
jgi:hypothetical protein